jgi:hypothetical protein
VSLSNLTISKRFVTLLTAPKAPNKQQQTYIYKGISLTGFIRVHRIAARGKYRRKYVSGGSQTSLAQCAISIRVSHEKNVSTKQSKAQAYPWIPRPHGYQGWTSGA